jgi:hypothetical protein
MMFIVRSAGEVASARSLPVKARRKTPEIVPNGAGKTDYFCVGDSEDLAALRRAGCDVVELRDGWYADDAGGGIAIWGQGKYWEVRDTPFLVREAAASAEMSDADGAAAEPVNVRRAFFGA